MISGARQGRSSGLRRLVSGAAARELSALVVPGIEVARARGLDIETAGLKVAPTPRHASVLVVVGELPEGLREAAAIIYAQMMRPRAVLAAGAGGLSPLPEADVSVELSQDALSEGVIRLRAAFAGGAFDPGAADFEPAALQTRTEYTCTMHPEVIQDEPGTCPKCGMELVPRETRQERGQEGHDHGDEDNSGHEEHHDHEGTHDHDSMTHNPADDQNGEHGHDPGASEHNHDYAEMNHEHMDHGDMSFMSMVEMTRGLPRSSDGLQMEWVEAPYGPLFPGLPGGLDLTLTLDGDTVAEAEAGSVVAGWATEDLTGPAETFPNRLARLNPLTPVAYRLLAFQAIENASGAKTRELERVRVGALERERAASHLGWLSSFGYLIGSTWISRRAADLQLSLLHAGAEDLERLRPRISRFIRRVRRIPLLERKLSGIGALAPLEIEGVFGPAARAGGITNDARTDDATYLGLGFEPVIREGGDAHARLKVRLAEIEQSLDLVLAAGHVGGLDHKLEAVSGTGTATVETPRGAASLRIELEGSVVVSVDLSTPSTAHVGLIERVAEGRELADALVGVASLDLSPWEIIG